MVKRRENDRARAPDVSIRFENDPGASREVRRALRALSTADDPIADDVAVVASELVSNVVQHTDYGGTAQAWDPKPDIPFRLEVTDASTQRLVPRDPTGGGGRGLHIVDELANRWGVNPSARGKTVWAEFDRTEPDDPNDS